VTCEAKKTSLPTHMMLEIIASADGEVHVFIDQSRVKLLKPTDIMRIQHGVETAFHELLASLPDDDCTQKVGTQGA